MKLLLQTRPLAILSLAFFCGAAPAQEQAEAALLRETIREWAKTERLVSEERSAWEADKARMGELMEIYRKELALLDEELATAGQSAGSFDERLENAKRETAAFREARQKMSEIFARARPRLVELSGRFPETLRQEVATDLALLEEWDGKSETRDGMRSLIAVLTAADDFNRRVTRATEVRALADGRETQVNVIYLGLGRAYFTSADTAGVGTPGPDGWTWTEAPKLRPDIEKALAVLAKEGQPELVRLPVAVNATDNR